MVKGYGWDPIMVSYTVAKFGGHKLYGSEI